MRLSTKSRPILKYLLVLVCFNSCNLKLGIELPRNNSRFVKNTRSISCHVLPDLIESVPAGRQSSPGRRNKNMVFSGSV